MASVGSVLQRGVCGNFRFKMYDITNAKNTNSVINTDMRSVQFVAATNTTDGADHFKAQTLLWTGTVDSDVENALTDSSETFVAELSNLQLFNTTDAVGTPTSISGNGAYDKNNTDKLDITHAGVAFDLYPTGNETYSINNEKFVMLDPVTTDDDGTLFIMGE